MATPMPSNRAPFTLDEVIEATGATLADGPGALAVEGVSTDTRRLVPGQLFVALRGERFDGHDHVAAAIAGGAPAVLVERALDAPRSVAVLRVPDTLEGLGGLAAFHRRRFDLPLIGVTGSVGKTTTKELLRAALEGVGRSVASTAGNLNNRIGVPLTLLTLERHHDAAVVELGMNLPGEIATLAALARPTIGVVTAVAAVHTEGVGDIAGVAREKGSLLTALGSEGAAVTPEGERLLAPYLDRSGAGLRLTFGTGPGSTVRLERSQVTAEARTEATYRIGERSLHVALRVLGEGHALAGAAVLAVAEVLGEDLDTVGAVLEEVPPTPGRLAPIELPGDVLVLDDSYNASPRSVHHGLRTAQALARARGGRPIAALADMRELGASAPQQHAEVVEAAAAAAAACVVLGPAMAEAAKGRPSVRVASDVNDVASAVRAVLQPRDVVLVKGSRSLEMERVVASLRGGAGT